MLRSLLLFKCLTANSVGGKEADCVCSPCARALTPAMPRASSLQQSHPFAGAIGPTHPGGHPVRGFQGHRAGLLCLRVCRALLTPSILPTRSDPYLWKPHFQTPFQPLLWHPKAIPERRAQLRGRDHTHAGRGCCWEWLHCGRGWNSPPQNNPGHMAKRSCRAACPGAGKEPHLQGCPSCQNSTWADGHGPSERWGQGTRAAGDTDLHVLLLPSRNLAMFCWALQANIRLYNSTVWFSSNALKKAGQIFIILN